MNKHSKTEYDRHHLVPKSKDGSDSVNNIVVMKRKEHEALHILYSNEGFKEALIKLFLLGEKCLKDGRIKKQLRECLKDIEYKKDVFINNP